MLHSSPAQICPLRRVRGFYLLRSLFLERLNAVGLLLAFILAGFSFSHAQQSSEAPTVSPPADVEHQQSDAQRGAMGGMANAGPHEASFDSQHRPITAGGFVKIGPIIFQDIAAAAGLVASWRRQ